ncbi:hypothetical protein LTR97_004953 [Elasticomyces elasticus]|uniref:Fungal N-terminal domain-containing protein n=1 Tax=Elasticomyces elasticus TaxID=574655 RepID=A0AAN7ZUN6_9PEZI|nr:hypothetical protein LTR97_004953 [Elasticomyces elasticus]
MKFSTIALACTMAPFATAAWPHDDLPRGQGIDYEGIYAFSKSIAQTMTAINATLVEERISNFTAALDDMADFICEGKVSPFTPACETAVVQHAYLLRETREAYKTQVESNRGLWDAWDETPHKDKFGKDWSVRSHGLEAQQLEAGEAAANLDAGIHESAKRLNACKPSFKDAKEMCSRARPLNQDELIMKLAIAIIACPIFHATMVESAVTSSPSSDVPSYHEILESRKLDIVAMQQKSHQLALAMKYYEQHLSAVKRAGNFEGAQAMEKTHDRHTLLDKFTQECIETDQKFILVFENALATTCKNFSSLVASWDSERVHVRQPGSKALGEFTAAFVKQLELCNGLSIVL